MNRVGLVSLLLLLGISLSPLWAREWTDASGSFRVEAELVSVKNQKAYLEKTDGTVAAVPLEKLSRGDLKHLLSLEKYSAYFRANPIPGMEASAPKPAAVQVEDKSTVGEVRHLSSGGGGVVASLAFSPDGRRLAAGTGESSLIMFDVNTSTETSRQTDLTDLGVVIRLVFTPDGGKLVSGGLQSGIRVWDVRSDGALAESRRFAGHGQRVLAIAVSSDGKTVLSHGDREKVRCWDLETGREKFVVDGFKRDVKEIVITDDGKRGLACDGQSLTVIDMKDGSVIQTWKLLDNPMRGYSIAPDGSQVLIPGITAMRIWNARDGQELRPLRHAMQIHLVTAYTPNARYALGGTLGKVDLWDVKGAVKIREFSLGEPKAPVLAIACSPDNRHLAVAGVFAEDGVRVYRLPTECAED